MLRVEGLSVEIQGRAGRTVALRDVSLEVAAGEVVGLVGESGGGKTMVARAVVGLLPEGAHATGHVWFHDDDVLRMLPERLRAHRGHGAALCFQNPRGALSPTRAVGRQLTDRLATHQGMEPRAARAAAQGLFEAVGLRSPARRLDAYPHELSGGMAQRVMISLAIGCAPGLLIADEPTTGLDVTLAREILTQFRELASGTGRLGRELASGTGRLDRAAADAGGRGVLLISHDLASVAQVCDRVVVLRAGTVVESGPAHRVLREPTQAYTRDLLAAVPDLAGPVRRPRPATTDRTVLAVEDAHVVYRSRFSGGGHHALRGVSLRVQAGETVGVVGESGCGKSTLARLILGLVRPSAGAVAVAGEDLARVRGKRLRQLRTRAQLVFQDPVGSLSPRRTVADAIAEPLRAQRVPATERDNRVAEVLARMGLDESILARRPHQISGGQAQRVGIARALVGKPDLLVFDEPTSALDVTVQAQILAVIAEVTAGSTHGSVFISHDLATVRGFCDRVVVLYLGTVVEEGPVAEVFAHPRHPYTRALLSSVASLVSGGAGFTGPRVELVKDLEEADAGSGCPLAPRCPLATERCGAEEQVLTAYGPSRVACWRVPEFSWEGGSVAR